MVMDRFQGGSGRWQTSGPSQDLPRLPYLEFSGGGGRFLAQAEALGPRSPEDLFRALVDVPALLAG